MNNERIAMVAGAIDLERAYAIELVTQAGIPTFYATADDRLILGNAYRANGISPDFNHNNFDQIWRFECDGPVFAGIPSQKIVVIDHHRPGDPGYGRPPAEFLPASSIGQVISLLARRGLIGEDWWPDNEGWPEYLRAMLAYPTPGQIRWAVYATIDSPDYWGGWIVHTPLGWRLVPHDFVLIAAADHCLAAAYRGECPGVDPDTLMRWRVEQRAAYQGRSAEEVLADIEAARQRLREMVNGEGWADVHSEHIPELPEAACREGIPYLAEVTEPGTDRKKVVLGAAPPHLVKKFMGGKIVPHLIDYYGDPERGFAGGYME